MTSQVDQILADIDGALYGDDPVRHRDLRTALLILREKLEMSPDSLPLQDIIRALEAAT